MLSSVFLIKAEIKYHMAMMNVGMELSKHKITKHIGDDLFTRHALENLSLLTTFVDVVKERKKAKDELIDKLNELENELHEP